MPPKKKFNDMCADLLDTQGDDPEDYVRNVMKGLGNVNKKDMTDTEQMAVNVSALLIPLLTNIIAKTKATTKIECALRVNAYKLDELEQYGRRENVRISGIKEEEGENLKQKIVDLARAMDIVMETRDINVTHRLGKPGISGTTRNIICRFVSRDTKFRFLTEKKKLKLLDTHKQVYINEDLTPLRQKLFFKLRRSGKFESCYTRDGSIRCKSKDGNMCQVSSPDDLFKAGYNDIDYSELSLNYLCF
jgi:hypothetical protein